MHENIVTARGLTTNFYGLHVFHQLPYPAQPTHPQSTTHNDGDVLSGSTIAGQQRSILAVAWALR